MPAPSHKSQRFKLQDDEDLAERIAKQVIKNIGRRHKRDKGGEGKASAAGGPSAGKPSSSASGKPAMSAPRLSSAARSVMDRNVDQEGKKSYTETTPAVDVARGKKRGRDKFESGRSVFGEPIAAQRAKRRRLTGPA